MGSQHGERRSTSAGDGAAFADHRRFASGDSLRRVDWHAYQRLRTVLVKLCEEERSLGIAVVLDCSASMDFPGKLQRAGTLAAVLALLGLRQGDAVTLRCVGALGGVKEVRGRSPADFARFLHVLEATQAGGPLTLDRTVVGGHSHVDRLLLISDLMSREPLDELLRSLRAASVSPLIFHVLGQADLRPDLRGPTVVRDVETGAEHRLAGGTADKRAYAAALAEWRSEVAHACAQRSVPLVDASTHLSLRTLIREVLPRAGVLERAR